MIFYLSLKYAIFAVIAIGVNMGTQRLVFHFWDHPLILYIALVLGTGTGLVVKYILDKKYIFYFQTRSLFHDSKLFLVYALMGVFTTVIFWGTEIAFDAFLDTQNAKYIGGTLGLAVGYLCKYHLDKRFVFRQQSNPEQQEDVSSS